jgi:hypothetical protein
MLGVTKNTVSQLAHRGSLDCHPDGGLPRASVPNRIVGALAERATKAQLS